MVIPISHGETAYSHTAGRGGEVGLHPRDLAPGSCSCHGTMLSSWNTVYSTDVVTFKQSTVRGVSELGLLWVTGTALPNASLSLSLLSLTPFLFGPLSSPLALLEAWLPILWEQPVFVFLKEGLPSEIP